MTYYPDCNLRGRQAEPVLGPPDGGVVVVGAKGSHKRFMSSAHLVTSPFRCSSTLSTTRL